MCGTMRRFIDHGEALTGTMRRNVTIIKQPLSSNQISGTLDVLPYSLSRPMLRPRVITMGKAPPLISVLTETLSKATRQRNDTNLTSLFCHKMQAIRLQV
jgi:hypothetical protein